VKLQTTTEVAATLNVTELAHLDAVLATYADLQAQKDAIEAQMATEKDVVMLILDEAGVKSVESSGYQVALIKGGVTGGRLSKAKLLAQGVTLAQIEMATGPSKPKKPYIRIAKPGEKKEWGGDEDAD
jgi:hypothetical protein